MKVDEFSKVLNAYADTLSMHGAESLAIELRRLTSAWSGHGSITVKSLFKRLTLGDVEKASEQVPSVGELNESIKQLKELSLLVSKKGFLDDLDVLIEALTANEKSSLADFSAAVERQLAQSKAPAKRAARSRKSDTSQLNTDLIDDYVLKLEETYTDAEAFGPIFAKLKADKLIKQSDMAEIATRFSIKTTKSTSRSKSLERIWSRHNSYSSSKSKSEFFGGRSAA